jgi:hypothetical protein
MTLELPVNKDGLSSAITRVIYPDSEFDEDGNLVVVRKKAQAPTEYIYLEAKGVRYKFRFTGDGQMNYENDVMTMKVEFVGFPDMAGS